MGGAIGLSIGALHPLPMRMPPHDSIDVHLMSTFGPLVGGALLVLLGAFVARLPELDWQLGLSHRGVTHSLVAVGVVTVLATSVAGAFLPPLGGLELAAVTGAAYLSHLAADSVNPMPVAILWPLARSRPRWLPSVREESLVGRAVEAAIWVLVLGVIGWRVRLAGA